jgi:hypothetical protein
MRGLILLAITGVAMAASLDDLTQIRVLPLGVEMHHVQGIDTDGEKLWVTSVDSPTKKGYLQEFSLRTGALIRGIEVGEGERFHPGGMASDETSLWLPVAEYRRNSTAIIEKRNKKTLAVEFRIEVPDHIGCVAVTKDEIIGGNWDSRIFYVWDKQGKLLRKVDNPTPNGYQDLKFFGGKLVASGLLPGQNGAIDWLNYPSLELDRRMTFGKTDRGAAYTREGMTIYRDELMLLPEDGQSRLFVYRLTANPK